MESCEGTGVEGQGEALLPSLSELEGLNKALTTLPEPQEWQYWLLRGWEWHMGDLGHSTARMGQPQAQCARPPPLLSPFPFSHLQFPQNPPPKGSLEEPPRT